MKPISLIIFMILFSYIHVMGQSNTMKMDTFKVYGNCGMCKKTIEQAAMSVKGVKQATWNIKSGIIEVTYNPKNVELLSIKKAIAAKGYDSDECRAPNEVYNNLHGCCQYDRPPQ